MSSSRPIRLALAAALASLFGAVHVPAAGAVTFTGSIESTDASHGNALFPQDAGTCAAANAPLGSTSPLQFHYDAYTLVNNDPTPSCVTVSYTASSAAVVVAYSPMFDPANPLSNFLGSTDASCTATSGGFSFKVPAGSSFVVEIEECTTGAGIGSYTLDVTGTGVTLAARFRALSATATRRGTLVRWRTSSELGVVGFDVYLQADGRRIRLNRRIIVARNSAGGSAYSYLDRSTRRHAARYWIQVVGVDGSRSWCGPVRTAGG